MKSDEIEILRQKLNSRDVTMTTLGDGTGVLLNIKGMVILDLNETGMFVINRIREGILETESLVTRIQDEFEIDGETARRDIAVFVRELGKALDASRPTRP
jgi:hypothetical protein